MRDYARRAGIVLVGLAAATLYGLPLVLWLGLPLWAAPVVGVVTLEVTH